VHATIRDLVAKVKAESDEKKRIARECVDALMNPPPPAKMTARQAFLFLAEEWKNATSVNDKGRLCVLQNQFAYCTCLSINVMQSMNMINGETWLKMRSLVSKYADDNNITTIVFFPANAIGALKRAAMCLELAEKAGEE